MFPSNWASDDSSSEARSASARRIPVSAVAELGGKGGGGVQRAEKPKCGKFLDPRSEATQQLRASDEAASAGGAAMIRFCRLYRATSVDKHSLGSVKRPSLSEQGISDPIHTGCLYLTANLNAVLPHSECRAAHSPQPHNATGQAER